MESEKSDDQAIMDISIAKTTPYEEYGITMDYVPGVKSAREDMAGLDGHGLVIDYMQNIARSGKVPYLGFAFYVSALNTDIVMDFTTEMGKCTGMYWGYVFQMPKWSYNVAKVSEDMEVSPSHPDAYNLFVGQRNRIEGQIKQGLQSAAQAVTDFELLAHDERRYKEILDYFRDEKQRGDEHVLRSLFVDRVDAHTGEGYSMITMAKRWPTIITDFIRMGQSKYKEMSWTIDSLVKELDVTQAEATVLQTKDRLFRQWKEMFRPTVAERHARIKAMVDARKASIEQYKTWLRPYVVRHKLMKEASESGGAFATSQVHVPAFGAQYAFSNVRLWVWKAFPITERRKPWAKTERAIGGINWIIDPYDDFVREWAKRIEYKYQLKPGYFSEDKVRSLLQGWAKKVSPQQAEGQVLKMVPSELYYVLFDVKFERGVIKVPPPAGGENEDLMINPLRTWIASQNVMLVHLLELHAKEQAFSREVDEMLGARPVEEHHLEQTKSMLLGKKEAPVSKGNPAKRFMDGATDRYGRAKRRLGKFSKFFFRPGPYESSFYERVVKMYLVDVGGLYGQQVDFWKSRAGVG